MNVDIPWSGAGHVGDHPPIPFPFRRHFALVVTSTEANQLVAELIDHEDLPPGPTTRQFL